MKPKIAIVDGAGFIGKSLARHLSKKFQVKILDVRTPPEDLEDFVAYTHCDVRDYQEVEDGLNDVDLVIHVTIVRIPLINEQKSLGYAVNVVEHKTSVKLLKKTQESEESLKEIIRPQFQ